MNENTIIIVKCGNGNSGLVLYITNKSYISNSSYILNNIIKEIDVKYLYYYLKINENKLKKLSKGSVVLGINKNDLGEKIIIPIIQLEDQITISNTLHDMYNIYNNLIEKKKRNRI